MNLNRNLDTFESASLTMLQNTNKDFRAGNYASAKAGYDQLAKKEPRNHWHRLNAIMCCIRQGELHEAKSRLEKITESPHIPAEIIHEYQTMVSELINESGSGLGKVNIPSDFNRNSKETVAIKALRKISPERKIPSGFPFDMTLPSLVGNCNDFGFLVDHAHQFAFQGNKPSARIHLIITAETRLSFEQSLDRILEQTYPLELITISAYCPDPLDSSIHDVLVNRIDGKFWQINPEQQKAVLCRDNEVLIFINDTTELTNTTIERIARYFSVSDNLVLPLVGVGSASDDFHGAPIFKESEIHRTWKKHKFPFREVLGFNFAVSANKFNQLGLLQPSIEHEALNAKEFCFRAYNLGAYFIPVAVCSGSITAKENKPSSDEYNQYIQYIPTSWDRKSDGIFKRPKVSIYIPAYKAEKYIRDAVESVLRQDYEDLEICIAIDGLADKTVEVLETYFSNNPKVKWSINQNGGIGFASNTAIEMSNGIYIGQLDADDKLKAGAIKRLVAYLDNHTQVGCVYSSCERVDADGNYIKDEYSFPVFSREKMLMTSIAHHFRMFRRQCWERTEKFREDIVNAVDYDMFLKLSEVTEFHHIDEIFYQRRWHGENTSNVNEAHQTTNTYVVQRKALARMGLDAYWDVHIADPSKPRNVTFKRTNNQEMVIFWPDYSRSNPYQKLLYSQMRQTTEVVAGSIDAALKIIDTKSTSPKNIIFHLHWLNFIFGDVSNQNDAAIAANTFMEKVRKFIWKGGRFVWTIHNTVSHDTPFHEVETSLSARLTQCAHALHVHSEASIQEIVQSFPVPREKVVVSRHGNYIGTYPNFIHRDVARSTLGIEKSADVILFTGQIRPYKGVENLIQAFRNILDRRPSTYLLIAGKSDFNILEESGLTAIELSRIIFLDRFIENEELQLFFNAADIAVYPYNKVLTSGSLLLALSFGVPSVIPRVGMTSELMDKFNAGQLYDASTDEKALEIALLDLLNAKEDGKLQAIANNAARAGVEMRWPDFGIAIK